MRPRLPKEKQINSRFEVGKFYANARICWWHEMYFIKVISIIENRITFQCSNGEIGEAEKEGHETKGLGYNEVFRFGKEDYSADLELEKMKKSCDVFSDTERKNRIENAMKEWETGK